MEPATVDHTTRRELRHAPADQYPGIDIDRANELAAGLADAQSDSEAISRLRGSSVQVVYQEK